MEGLLSHSFSDDKLFLANFIVTNFLGPDVLSEIPRRSVAKRLSRRFPPYTSNQLGNSSLTISQLKSLYYYALRNANPTLIFTPSQFHAYLKGRNHRITNFTTFFPLHLHKHKAYTPSSSSTSAHELVKGIVLIDDAPAPVDESTRSYIDRFRQLSGLTDLKMDAKLCLTYRHQPRTHDDDDEGGGDDDHNRQHHQRRRPRPWVLFQDKYKRRRIISDDNDRGEIRSFPTAEEVVANHSTATVVVNDKTVTFRLVGVSSGLVVIGISRTAYYFRIALPALPNNFRGLSCEVSSDGKVEIAQELAPDYSSGGGPPPFMFSFYLPGPVDPRLCSPNLRSDGVLEAVVVKQSRG